MAGALSVAQSRVLRLYDLDGTLTTPSLTSREGSAYRAAAARHVATRLPMGSFRVEDIESGVARAIDETVFPARHLPKFWAKFATTQQALAAICPCVDHYLLTQFGTQVYLAQIAAAVGAHDPVRSAITTFLADPQWANRMYGVAAKAAESFAEMDDDARTALEAELTHGNRYAAIFTNSSLGKARGIVARAGLERFVVENQLRRGKLGLIGDGRKAVVDEAWPRSLNVDTRWGTSVDVTEYFGEPIAVDLRRRAFYERVAALVQEIEAAAVAMVSDIGALDLVPIANWTAFRPTVVMRRTPMSVAHEERMVAELLGGHVVGTFSQALACLDARD